MQHVLLNLMNFSRTTRLKRSASGMHHGALGGMSAIALRRRREHSGRAWPRIRYRCLRAPQCGESGFAPEMFGVPIQRGFRAHPQVRCGGDRIDFLVQGNEGRRLTIGCAGDRCHGPAFAALIDGTTTCCASECVSGLAGRSGAALRRTSVRWQRSAGHGRWHRPCRVMAGHDGQEHLHPAHSIPDRSASIHCAPTH